MSLLVNKRGLAECAKRLNPPSTLETACQTDTCDLKLSSYLTFPFPYSSTSLSIFSPKIRAMAPFGALLLSLNPSLYLSPGQAHSAGPPLSRLKLEKKSTRFRHHFLLIFELIFELKFGRKTVICWFRSLLFTRFLNLPVLQPIQSWKKLFFHGKTMVFAYPGHLSPCVFDEKIHAK